MEFNRYASSHNLPLEAISVGDENKVLCEMHYAANAPRNIYSHTKSFTVTAVGLAMEEGKLSLKIMWRKCLKINFLQIRIQI